MASHARKAAADQDDAAQPEQTRHTHDTYTYTYTYTHIVYKSALIWFQKTPLLSFMEELPWASCVGVLPPERRKLAQVWAQYLAQVKNHVC